MYVGQGLIATRLQAHLARTRLHEHPQGRLFAAGAPLACSWVANKEWLLHQRLELENDIIASHLIATGEVPSAQFRG
jgi:hypothetical protein